VSNDTVADAYAYNRRVHFLNNGKVACGRTVDFTSMDPDEVNCQRCLKTNVLGLAYEELTLARRAMKEDEDGP
jgi:hypothetical protein